MQLSLSNLPPQQIRSQFVAILLVFTIFIFNACKKELIFTEPKNLSSKTTAKNITTITYTQFLQNVNIANTGSLKEVLTAKPNKQNGNSISAINNNFELDLGNVKKLVVNDTISFVISLKPSTPRATAFGNLTIQESKDKTIAFLTTFIPTKTWIKDFKTNKRMGFEGEVLVNKIDINDAFTKLNKTSGTNTSGLTTANIINIGGSKISLAPGECEIIELIEVINFPCKTGHWTRAECNYFDT